ncbi:hypothetical protein BAE44_0001470, partial [Dichanthelium oligosanthes]
LEQNQQISHIRSEIS